MSRRYYLSRRRHQGWVSLVVLLLTFGVWFGQDRGWFGGAARQAEQNEPGMYKVVHYDDGDTIAVDMNGHTETLRFIGVDTPETHDPRKPVQCFGPEAAAYTKRLISSAGGKVRLASDSMSTNRDRYDRLLRYIYLPDGTLVQDKLVSGGYAFYYPYFPFTKAAQFEAEEKQAMASKRGLWAVCHPSPTDSGGYTSNALGT